MAEGQLIMETKNKVSIIDKILMQEYLYKHMIYRHIEEVTWIIAAYLLLCNILCSLALGLLSVFVVSSLLSLALLFLLGKNFWVFIIGYFVINIFYITFLSYYMIEIKSMDVQISAFTVVYIFNPLLFYFGAACSRFFVNCSRILKLRCGNLE